LRAAVERPQPVTHHGAADARRSAGAGHGEELPDVRQIGAQRVRRRMALTAQMRGERLDGVGRGTLRPRRAASSDATNRVWTGRGDVPGGTSERCAAWRSARGGAISCAARVMTPTQMPSPAATRLAAWLVLLSACAPDPTTARGTAESFLDAH